MNSEFEKQVAEQPLRMAPAEWRAEVLRTARCAAAEPTPATSLASGWLSWLWPAPKAWAALAACWMVLLAVNTLNQPKLTVSATRADAATLALALAEKQRALQEMDVKVVANHAKPAAPHVPAGASGWLRDGKGSLPC